MDEKQLAWALRQAAECIEGKNWRPNTAFYLRQAADALAEKSPARESEITTSEAVCNCWVRVVQAPPHALNCPRYKAEAGSERHPTAVEQLEALQPTTESPTTADPSAVAEPTGHPIPRLPQHHGQEREATFTHVAQCLDCQGRLVNWSLLCKMLVLDAPGNR